LLTYLAEGGFPVLASHSIAKQPACTRLTAPKKHFTVIIRTLSNKAMVTTSTVDRTNLAQWHDVLAPHSLGYRLKLLAQLGSRRLQEVLEPYGLTAFHWLVLCCLWQEDGLPTSSIGDKLQQVGGTLTGVLDRMEDRGLVRRERDTRDRRIWRIWLTDSGRELQEVLPPLVAAIRDRSVEGFSEADRELFSQLIDRAILNLSQTD